MNAERTFVWATSDPSPIRAAVESGAAQFDMAARFCTHAELFQVLGNVRAAVLVIEFGVDVRPGLALLAEVAQRMPRLMTLVASSDVSLSVMRAAIEAGAADILSLPLNAQELNKALIKVHQIATRTSGAQAPSGTLVTVYGARGGLGVTTLAVNLAFQLAAITDRQTVLVDLDLQRGDVAAFLNLTPMNSLATLATTVGPVDDIFLAGTLTRHPKGVFVLPAPLQIEEAETVGHDHVDTALRLLRTQFAYTVVDTARMITSPTLAAFEQSDHILLLFDRSVPGLRAARRTVEVLLRLNIPADRIRPILSQVVPGPIGMQDVVRALGKEPFATIPRDEASASAAVNAGVPLNGKQSPLSLAIAEIARKVTGLAPPARPKGLFQRVFSKEARK
jgi:pilus assembly protein CpaE